MDFNQLKTIYPAAQLNDDPLSDNPVFSIPYHQQWIQIPQKNLSTSEKKLLTTMFSTAKAQLPQLEKHFWYQFLWKNTQLSPSQTGSYRIIQFAIRDKSNQANQADWLEAFQSIFNHTEDAFFIDDSYGILIQKYDSADLNFEEIAGVTQTLEDDFSIKTICYIGQYWELTSDFPLLFNEERAIFKQQQEQNKGLAVLSLAQAALSYYVKSATEQSDLLTELKKTFADQVDWQELVKALWETQGNISMAAKSLYVHRNTLQYRIDRFNEATSFSLKNKDDLMLCYLLLL